MQAPLTAHARARMRQRGIGADALDRLLEFGREAFDHHGGTLLYFDKAARRRLERAAGNAGRTRMPKSAGLYAVLSGTGEVVTVGHRTRRINRA